MRSTCCACRPGSSPPSGADEHESASAPDPCHIVAPLAKEPTARAQWFEHVFYNEWVLLGSGRYRFVSRPAAAPHRHPVLIFDSEDRLHLPLTTFAREATRRLSASSVRVYLYAALPFFTFLDRTRPGAELR